MAYKKGLGVHSSSGGGGNHRARPYALMFMLAFGAALLGAMVLHRLREKRIYNLVVQEKDRQLLALQLLLQKERNRNKEMKKKNEEIKAKIHTLINQKIELDRRVLEMKSSMDSLRDEQRAMESAFEEKQNEISMLLQGKGSNLGKGGAEEVIALKESLMQKEAEIKELKHRLEIPDKVSINDPTFFPENVTANGTVAAQDKTESENEEKDEHSIESAKYGDDGKHITNEEASENKLTKFKGGEVTVQAEDEIQDRKEKDDGLIGTVERAQRQETWQEKKNEDSQNDGRVVVTAKDTDMKVKENATIGEEQPGQLENNSDGGGRHFHMKQLENNSGVAAGVKRKHGHASRTKAKRWRMIVKRRSLGNNGISESKKLYRDKQGGSKQSIVGRVSADENVVKEEEGMDNNNPSKDQPQTNLLKPENHENKEDSKIVILNDTNHQVTDDGIDMHPKKQRLDEIRQSEKQEKGFVEQNWSGRHVKIADKNPGKAKSNGFHEETEELKAADVQKQDKDVTDGGDDAKDNGDFFKESQSDFEDEKDESREEIRESEFQAD